jgi:hypothetical protein
MEFPVHGLDSPSAEDLLVEFVLALPVAVGVRPKAGPIPGGFLRGEHLQSVLNEHGVVGVGRGETENPLVEERSELVSRDECDFDFPQELGTDGRQQLNEGVDAARTR